MTLEKRMRSLARDQQQTDFIDLLVRVAIRDAESNFNLNINLK